MHIQDLFWGIINAFTIFTTSVGAEHDPIWSIILTLIGSVVYATINIITRIITSALEKKGIISHNDKQDIDNVAEDLSDDGKINNSNKKE